MSTPGTERAEPMHNPSASENRMTGHLYFSTSRAAASPMTASGKIRLGALKERAAELTEGLTDFCVLRDKE